MYIAETRRISNGHFFSLVCMFTNTVIYDTISIYGVRKDFSGYPENLWDKGRYPALKINLRELAKTSFLHLLRLFLAITLSPIFIVPMQLIASLSFPDALSGIARTLFFAVCGGCIELVLLFSLFYGDLYNNKNAVLANSLLALCVALIFQLLIACINHFYVYTGGWCVSNAGTFLCMLKGEVPQTPEEVPTVYYLILTAVFNIFRVSSLLLAYRLAKRKHASERKEILGIK